MNPKDFIEQLKDYADIADASYAMLHYVEENEVFDIDDDKFRANNTAFELQGRWVYADGIKLGYKNIGFNGKFYTFPYFLTFLLKRYLKEK